MSSDSPRCQSPEDLRHLIASTPGLIAFFSTSSCRVCGPLFDKVQALVAESFPRIEILHVDCEANAELAGQFGVFAVPTLIVYFDGREFVRKSRHVGVAELAEELSRPYEVLFDTDVNQG